MDQNNLRKEENINRFVIQQDRKESNPFQYVLQQRVQKGKYLMAIQLMEKRNASANNYGKLFNKMKRFFTS